MLLKLPLIALCITFTSASAFNFPSESGVNYTALLEQSRGTKAYESTVDTIISRGVLKLTLALQKFIAYKSPADNVVFAPVNIGGALALVLLGSSGKTFEEISKILGLASGIDVHSNSERIHTQIGQTFDKLDRTSSFEIGEEIKLASAIFVQEDFPIRNVFKQTAERIYRSEVLNVDFRNGEKARNTVNAWVSDRTNNKIKTMLEENPPDTTKVIIASALYFKAAWEKPFFPIVTKKQPFYPNGRDQKSDIMIEMMSNGGLFPYYQDRKLNCEIMGFPYKGNKSTLYVVMPNMSDKEKLLELHNRLTPDELERLVDNAKYTMSVIGFPKMRLESSLDLSSALSEFGAKSLFNPREANLALLSPGFAKPSFASPSSYLNEQSFGSNVVNNQAAAGILDSNNDNEQVLIFSRTGIPVNCTEIFDPTSNITKCQEIDEATRKEVVYKKFGDKVGRRITRQSNAPVYENIDTIRHQLTENDNPGLYADKVLHKVYMDITETGTEAAATTSLSLSRGGDITIFRIDQPFIFFIRNHETRLILFWGSVTVPTPHFKN